MVPSSPVLVPAPLPARKRSYPVTPTLSLAACHERVTDVGPPLAERPPGADGACVSAVLPPPPPPPPVPPVPPVPPPPPLPAQADVVTLLDATAEWLPVAS